MEQFFMGLCLAVLGFGIYQFSRIFGLYSAQNEKGAPWPYLVLFTISYGLIGLGAIIMAFSLM